MLLIYLLPCISPQGPRIPEIPPRHRLNMHLNLLQILCSLHLMTLRQRRLPRINLGRFQTRQLVKVVFVVGSLLLLLYDFVDYHGFELHLLSHFVL